MKRKWLIVLMGGLVLVGIVGSGALASQRVDVKFNGKRFRAYVHPQKGRYEIRIMPRRESEVGAARVLSGLDLTTEQREKVGKLQVVFQKDILELRLQLEEKQLELKRLLLKDSPVQEEIEALVDEMGTVWAEIQKENISLRMRLGDILTEEQLAMLRRMEATRSRAEITRQKKAFLTEEQLLKLRRREGIRSRAEVMRKNRFFSHFR